MKHTFAKLLLVSSIAYSITLAPLTAYSFMDTQGSWAEQSINRLSSMGIINGYPNGTFKPEGLISRAEFSAVLVKALGLSSYNQNQSDFLDVKPGYWAFNSIESVSANNYVSGYPGGYFYPNRNITRAEALTVITKASKVAMLDTQQSDTLLGAYPDNTSIPVWARTSVATAIKNNIFRPNNNTLDASRYASRADIATYTDNLMLTLKGQPNNNTAYIPTQPNATTTTPSTTTTNTVSVVPANTVFNAVLSTAVSSDRSQVGDTVSARLEAPLVANDGKIIAPAGSEIRGIITVLEKPQIAEQSGGVTINFNQLVLVDGKTIPVSAEINTTGGKLNAATLPERLLAAGQKTLTGAAIGSGAGVILAAIKDKSQISDYLLRGGVIGAGAGLASSLTDKGKALLLLPGDTLELRLRQTLFLNNGPQ